MLGWYIEKITACKIAKGSEIVDMKNVRLNCT